LDDKELRALAESVKQGDRRSFRLLVESLSRTLVAMAFRYTGDWEWARDLTQETWLRVHTHIDRWEPSRSFTAWLHAIHRNGCIDHLRRGWVRYESTPGSDQISRLVGVAPENPEADLERREFQGRLMEAMSHLSESQRQVFLRVDVEQGDQQTVAESLGIKFNTLRTTLHHARKRMAGILREMEGGTP